MTAAGLSPNLWRRHSRHFASFASRDKADRDKLMRAQAEAAGAVPVNGFLAIGAGLLGGGWYAGWFEGELSKPDRMVQELQRKGVRVVVFDVDHVIFATSVGDGLPRHELSEFLARASQDFVPAARVLAQQGFKLAVTCRGRHVAHRHSSGGSRVDREAFLHGPDIARALISQRCPDILPRFEVMGGHPDDEGIHHRMRDIAKHYRVECREVLLFTASLEDLSNKDGWIGVLCPSKREGFRFEDLWTQ